MNPSWKATAYCEAGRAVAAVRLRLRIYSVTINRTPHRYDLRAVHMRNVVNALLLHAVFGRPKHDWWMIGCFLAGLAAAEKYSGRQATDLCPAEGKLREQLFRMLKPGASDAYWRRARNLWTVPVNWRAVTVLAEELRRQKTLDGATVYRIVGEVLKARTP